MKRLWSLLLITLATRAYAQVPITESVLTPDAAAAIVAFYNHDTTTKLSGDTRIAAGNEVTGNVAILEGIVTFGGHVGGDLMIINGSVTFEPGARVDGDVTVIGGMLRGVGNLTAKSVTWHRERLKYELRDGVLSLTALRSPELSAGHEFEFGRTDFLVAARGGYNRSEGLPVYAGPRLTLRRRNPTLVEGLFIFRSAAAFQFDEQDYGYAIRAEQFIGGRQTVRAGVRVANEIQPVETIGLSDRENSLSTLVFHHDYRDHYNRKGFSAYLASERKGLELGWRLSYNSYHYTNAELRDPYSFIDNPDPWRPEVHVPDVSLHTLDVQLSYDTRNEDRDPASGWLIRGELEAPLAVNGAGQTEFSKSYRYGSIDIRRYARLSPYSRLSLHAVTQGTINGALPTFRQQSLGGYATLPGYKAYEYDCGGHDAAFFAHTRSPYYGCDRMMLFQVDYQVRFRWLSLIGRSIGRDFGLLENIRGVLFLDSGHAWNGPDSGRPHGTRDFVTDAGFGLRFGVLGLYWALPLNQTSEGFNFFGRLEPRF